MNLQFYEILQWLQILVLTVPLILIYTSGSGNHLLWLFAAYFHVHLLFELLSCFGEKTGFTHSMINHFNTMIQILNVFDGVWCIFIVHYGATTNRLKNMAGTAAVLLFAGELVYALFCGVNITDRVNNAGISIIATLLFLLWWLHEHYQHYDDSRQQKAMLYLNVSMIINYGVVFLSWLVNSHMGDSKNGYPPYRFTLIISNIIYVSMAATGIWLHPGSSWKPHKR